MQCLSGWSERIAHGGDYKEDWLKGGERSRGVESASRQQREARRTEAGRAWTWWPGGSGKATSDGVRRATQTLSAHWGRGQGKKVGVTGAETRAHLQRKRSCYPALMPEQASLPSRRSPAPQRSDQQGWEAGASTGTPHYAQGHLQRPTINYRLETWISRDAYGVTGRNHVGNAMPSWLATSEHGAVVHLAFEVNCTSERLGRRSGHCRLEGGSRAHLEDISKLARSSALPIRSNWLPCPVLPDRKRAYISPEEKDMSAQASR